MVLFFCNDLVFFNAIRSAYEGREKESKVIESIVAKLLLLNLYFSNDNSTRAYNGHCYLLCYFSALLLLTRSCWDEILFWVPSIQSSAAFVGTVIVKVLPVNFYEWNHNKATCTLATPLTRTLQHTSPPSFVMTYILFPNRHERWWCYILLSCFVTALQCFVYFYNSHCSNLFQHLIIRRPDLMYSPVVVSPLLLLVLLLLDLVR